MANKFVGSDQANTVINTMLVEGEDQVMLKVKVVEIQRDVMKQFGVDFAAMLDFGKVAFNLVNAPNNLTNVLAGGSGLKSGASGGKGNFETLVRAMEQDGLVRTLAEPNLTAMTGQAAKFHAGGEIPITVDCGDDRLGRCIDYKNYGVEVNFTPTVLSEDRIILKISTNVSEVAEGNAFTTRSTDTTLELPSGGSMMIAGLIKETSRQSLAGTPGVKQIPILGQLFRSQDFMTNETELVVFVTPVLVRPTSQSKLTTPDKGFVPPSDKQSIFMGRLNKVYGGTAGSPDGAYHGNVGFIVE
jgi:pilus assembly protein CpaC